MEEGVIRYPTADLGAGQLYAHYISPNQTILLTCGLIQDNEPVIGLGSVAAGMYVCVARNVEVTESMTIEITVESG